MTGFADQHVLVTAGAAGIGRAIAEVFLNAGAAVTVCDIDVQALARFRADHPGAGTITANVSDPDQVDALFDRIERLDVLVNNAGNGGPAASLEDIAPKDWRNTVAVNLDAGFLCCRRAIPLMKAQGKGSIIFLSSTAGMFGYPKRSPYAAAKWAVIGLTKSLAAELGPHGVRVNAICPGPVSGPRMDWVVAAEAKAHGRSEAEVRDSYTRSNSLRSFIDPTDIAQAALFLCSDAASRITGQALPVDGHTETL